MADPKPTQILRLVTSCEVPGVHKDGDALLIVVSDQDDPDCVVVRVGGTSIRVRTKLLKLAVDHAAETVPKW